MAIKKTKRFNQGQSVYEDDPSDPMELANTKTNLDTAKGPSVASSPVKRAPMVTKEQLGGMSLRDYLNQQQGLTRRGTPTDNSESPAGNIKLNSLRATKTPNFDPARLSSEPVTDSMRTTQNRQLTKPRAETAGRIAAKQALDKKAADTAEDQAIIDRIAKRTRPYMKDEAGNDMKRGGSVKKMAAGGRVTGYRGYGIAKKV